MTTIHINLFKEAVRNQNCEQPFLCKQCDCNVNKFMYSHSKMFFLTVFFINWLILPLCHQNCFMINKKENKSPAGGLET